MHIPSSAALETFLCYFLGHLPYSCCSSDMFISDPRSLHAFTRHPQNLCASWLCMPSWPFCGRKRRRLHCDVKAFVLPVTRSNANYSHIKLYNIFRIEYKEIQFITNKKSQQSRARSAISWGSRIIVPIWRIR